MDLYSTLEARPRERWLFDRWLPRRWSLFV